MSDYILAIETSCDDTSVAVVDTDYKVYANIISSQPDHIAFGGVLPELASRLHLKNLNKCLSAALNKANLTLNDISAVAVTSNPGLIGSLIVGVSFAKALAWSLDIPLVAVNHIYGHIMANKIEHPELGPPYLALVVSGGHTELAVFGGRGSVGEDEGTDESFTYSQTAATDNPPRTANTEHRTPPLTTIGHTLDDAAGECFDKVAKLLKLGFPGGPVIDKIAKDGNPQRFKFPRALDKKDNFNFSFSGLKTSVLNWTQKQTPEYINENLPDLVASIQQAIVDILVKKTVNAALKYQIDKVIVAGGVSANSCLRAEMKKYCERHNIAVYFPQMQYCMDNAAMIGVAAISKYLAGDFADLRLNATSTKGLR